MSLSAPTLSAITAALTAQASVVAESLNQCFSTKWTLEASPPLPFVDLSPDLLQVPGLVVHLTVEGSVILALLPESLPLPDWYRTPNDSQTARMETLAMEWSLNSLPPEVTAESYGTLRVPSLWDAVQSAEPESAAVVNVVAVAETSQSFWFVLPAARQPILPEPQSAPEFPQTPPAPRISRILSLPVTVAVQLARKRIELGALRELAPGSLVKFDKPCEDLLDLYVNNRLFCRGEAVKVGEKFGLKINEVGPVEQRLSAVIDRG